MNLSEIIAESYGIDVNELALASVSSNYESMEVFENLYVERDTRVTSSIKMDSIPVKSDVEDDDEEIDLSLDDFIA